MSLSNRLLGLFKLFEASGGIASLYNDDQVFPLLAHFPEYHDLVRDIEEQDINNAATVVLLSLRSLAKQRWEFNPLLVKTELVVTFPGAVTIPARHTAQVVRELLASARREIVIAGYAITTDGGLPELLALAAKSVTRIVVICGKWETKTGVTASQALLSKWPPFLTKPAIYEFKNASERELMHVKTLIVDSTDLLITSANFTHYGMNQNVEFGVRVTGEIAKNARMVFDEFIASGRFTRLP